LYLTTKRDPCPGGLDGQGHWGSDRQEKKEEMQPKGDCIYGFGFCYTLKYMYSELLLTLSLQSLYVP